MALDAPEENDAVFDVEGYTFLVDKHVLAAAQPITIDFRAYGLRITGNDANANRCV